MEDRAEVDSTGPQALWLVDPGAASSPVAPLRRDALRAWLTSPAVVGADGAVRSWWSPADDGYAYPEVGGLWLTAMCAGGSALRAAPEQVDAVAAWLCQGVEAVGAAGRGPERYLFDSAMVLSGLLDHAAARGQTDRTREAMDRLLAYLSDGVSRGAPVSPTPTAEAAQRWSLAFGSHLLKVTIALHKAATRLARPDALALIGRLVEPLSPLFDGRRFVVFAGSELSYLHGALYALEGLAYLDACGYAPFRAMLTQGAAWLEGIQGEDGSLPPFCRGAVLYGDPRSDAVAQAARLWLVVDRERWRPSIARALAYLGRQQAPSGGIRYRPRGPHLNTWASLFTLQALQWSSAPVIARELV